MQSKITMISETFPKLWLVVIKRKYKIKANA